MTTFLWVVVILMAAALLLEIVAFAGMAVVTMRAARRSVEIAEQIKQQVEPSVRLVSELQQFLQPRLEAMANERKQIAELVSTRSESLQATIEDTRRRAERIH